MVIIDSAGRIEDTALMMVLVRGSHHREVPSKKIGQFHSCDYDAYSIALYPSYTAML